MLSVLLITMHCVWRTARRCKDNTVWTHWTEAKENGPKMFTLGRQCEIQDLLHTWTGGGIMCHVTWMEIHCNCHDVSFFMKNCMVRVEDCHFPVDADLTQLKNLTFYDWARLTCFLESEWWCYNIDKLGIYHGNMDQSLSKKDTKQGHTMLIMGSL